MGTVKWILYESGTVTSKFVGVQDSLKWYQNYVVAAFGSLLSSYIGQYFIWKQKGLRF